MHIFLPENRTSYFPEMGTNIIPLDKAERKKQNESQIKQASHAVSLYLALGLPGNKTSIPAVAGKIQPAAGKTTMPGTAFSPAPVEKSAAPVTSIQASTDKRPA